MRVKRHSDNFLAVSITSGGNCATLFNHTLTATAPGTVVLSGLSNDGSHITTAKTVTIPKVDVASVAITTSPSINVGATVNLAATVLPTNASNPALTWAISGGNNAVASINGNTLHGLTVGTVNKRSQREDWHHCLLQRSHLSLKKVRCCFYMCK